MHFYSMYHHSVKPNAILNLLICITSMLVNINIHIRRVTLSYCDIFENTRIDDDIKHASSSTCNVCTDHGYCI